MLEFVRKWLTGSARAISIERDTYRLIDVEIAANNLAVDHHATEDGRANLPPPGSEVLSASERNISLYFEEEAQDAASKTAAKTQMDNQRIAESHVDSEIDQIQNIVPGFRSELQPLVAAHRDHLKSLKGQEQSILDDFSELNVRTA